MATAMPVEVNGIEILPDQCPRSEGWKTAGERARQKGMGELSLTPVLRESQGGAKATADVDSKSNNLRRRRHRQRYMSLKGETCKQGHIVEEHAHARRHAAT